MSDSQREAIMQRCLENMWGTKCKDCLDYSKHEQDEQRRISIEELGRGLF